MCGSGRLFLERAQDTGHDPEKWIPVFGQGHAQRERPKEKPRRGAGGLSASGPCLCGGLLSPRTNEPTSNAPHYCSFRQKSKNFRSACILYSLEITRESVINVC